MRVDPTETHEQQLAGFVDQQEWARDMLLKEPYYIVGVDARGTDLTTQALVVWAGSAFRVGELTVMRTGTCAGFDWVRVRDFKRVRNPCKVGLDTTSFGLGQAVNVTGRIDFDH